MSIRWARGSQKVELTDMASAELWEFPEWMRCDAETVLDVLRQDGGWVSEVWPHEQDAREKLERILRLIVADSNASPKTPDAPTDPPTEPAE